MLIHPSGFSVHHSFISLPLLHSIPFIFIFFCLFYSHLSSSFLLFFFPCIFLFCFSFIHPFCLVFLQYFLCFPHFPVFHFLNLFISFHPPSPCVPLSSSCSSSSLPFPPLFFFPIFRLFHVISSFSSPVVPHPFHFLSSVSSSSSFSYPIPSFFLFPPFFFYLIFQFCILPPFSFSLLPFLGIPLSSPCAPFIYPIPFFLLFCMSFSSLSTSYSLILFLSFFLFCSFSSSSLFSHPIPFFIFFMFFSPPPPASYSLILFLFYRLFPPLPSPSRLHFRFPPGATLPFPPSVDTPVRIPLTWFSTRANALISRLYVGKKCSDTYYLLVLQM